MGDAGASSTTRVPVPDLWRAPGSATGAAGTWLIFLVDRTLVLVYIQQLADSSTLTAY